MRENFFLRYSIVILSLMLLGYLLEKNGTLLKQRKYYGMLAMSSGFFALLVFAYGFFLVSFFKGQEADFYRISFSVVLLSFIFSPFFLPENWTRLIPATLTSLLTYGALVVLVFQMSTIFFVVMLPLGFLISSILAGKAFFEYIKELQIIGKEQSMSRWLYAFLTYGLFGVPFLIGLMVIVLVLLTEEPGYA